MCNLQSELLLFSPIIVALYAKETFVRITTCLSLAVLATASLTTSTSIYAAAAYMQTRNGCKVSDYGRATEVDWAGACTQGKATGLGTLSFKICDPSCFWAKIVGVMQDGNFAGMAISYTGDDDAANQEIQVGFYDSSGNDVAKGVVTEKRIPVRLPTAGQRVTFHLAFATAIAKGAKTRNLANGLTLDEVLLLWESWNSNPGSGPPRELASALQGTSPTASYLREQDAALAERDREFSEWKQRRDTRRAERGQLSSGQPTGQQQIATAIERYAAYKTLGIAIVEQTGDQAFYKSLDTCFYTVASRIANSVHVGNRCEHEIEWWNSGGSGGSGAGVIGPKQLMSSHFEASFNLPPSRVCLRNDIAASEKPGLCRIDRCKLNAASCGSGTGTAR
jgi:hypothetical protein